MGLDAKIELSLEGRRIMVVSVHPQTCMEAVADMLEDLATDIRRDLRSKTPILTLPQRLHEIDTSSHSRRRPHLLARLFKTNTMPPMQNYSWQWTTEMLNPYKNTGADVKNCMSGWLTTTQKKR